MFQVLSSDAVKCSTMLKKNHPFELGMCVSTDSIYITCLHLWPQSPPMHTDPHPLLWAHPQSTMTKGKSWVQDIRPPLAARVCPAQCFLQRTAVWDKPRLLSAHYRPDQGGWGHHQCMHLPGWSWGGRGGSCAWQRRGDRVASQLGRHDLHSILWSLYVVFLSSTMCDWYFPTLKLNHMTQILNNGYGCWRSKKSEEGQTQAERTIQKSVGALLPSLKLTEIQRVLITDYFDVNPVLRNRIHPNVWLYFDRWTPSLY